MEILYLPIFTPIPLFVFGVFEVPARDEYLEQDDERYKEGIASKKYSKKTFIKWICWAITLGTFIFYLTALTLEATTSLRQKAHGFHLIGGFILLVNVLICNAHVILNSTRINAFAFFGALTQLGIFLFSFWALSESVTLDSFGLYTTTFESNTVFILLVFFCAVSFLIGYTTRILIFLRYGYERLRIDYVQRVINDRSFFQEIKLEENQLFKNSVDDPNYDDDSDDADSMGIIPMENKIESNVTGREENWQVIKGGRKNSDE